MEEHEKEKVLVTFDSEWCDNVLHCEPKRDAREVSLMREGFRRFLDCCETNSASGIVFVVGETVPHVSDLLRRAKEMGFLIGNHSLRHKPISEMSVEEFRADLRESTEIIREATDSDVTCFRAPSFSMPLKQEYFEVLEKEGYLLDSSIAIGRHPSGYSGNLSDVDRLQSKLKFLTLKPVHSCVDGRNVFPGGGFFRIKSASSFCKSLKAQRGSFPSIVYFHPRDLLRVYYPRNTQNPMQFIKSALALGNPRAKLGQILQGCDAISGNELIQYCDGRTK